MATTRKETAAKTSSAKKSTPKKTTAAKKTTAKKKIARKYSTATSAKVGEVMDEMKRGKLRSGGSGKKVTDRKQAIAIGLSEARAEGKKVPPNPNRRKKSS